MHRVLSLAYYPGNVTAVHRQCTGDAEGNRHCTAGGGVSYWRSWRVHPPYTANHLAVCRLNPGGGNGRIPRGRMRLTMVATAPAP